MKKTLMRLFAVLFTFTAVTILWGKTFELKITPLKDLFEESETMTENNQPMLVVFSSPYCMYCEKIINAHIPKLNEDRRFAGKVLFRNVDFDNPDAMMVDANDEFISIRKFSEKYGVDYFPVVIFINSEGKEISKQIKGYDGENTVQLMLENGLLESMDRLSDKS